MLNVKKFFFNTKFKQLQKLKQDKKEINFLEIEKNIINIEKKLTENEFIQLNYEFIQYGKHYYNNNFIFLTIEKYIYGTFKDLLKNKNIFSEEYFLVNDYLLLNYNLLKKFGIKECHIKFSSQQITNWLLLSLNNNLIDKSYIENKQIWFSRYECIDNFSNYFYLYFLYYNSSYIFKKETNRSIQHLTTTIFNLMKEEKLFLSKAFKIKIKKRIKIKDKENNKSNKKYKLTISIKTYIFYSFENLKFYDNKINFNLFLNKPNLIVLNNQQYWIGIHFSTLTKIFKKNLKSEKKFQLDDTDVLDKLVSLEYKIDLGCYELIHSLICDDLNIPHNSDIKKFIIENLNNFYTSYEKFNDIEEAEKKYFQKQYNKYIIYYIFSDIKENIQFFKKFYLAIEFDFRGRIYSKSCISPIGSKIFRYIYFNGYYSENELNNKLNDISIEKIDFNIKKLLKESLFLKKLTNINLDNKLNLFYSYWIIFEIGKSFKNKIITEKDGKLNNLDFINHGCHMIYNIDNKIIKLNLEESIEYYRLILSLIDLNNSKYKKILIFKDATASGIQILSIILGVKNDEILKNCNLKSDNFWYDTYFYIIKCFLEEYKQLLKLITLDYNKYTERTYLKSSIMTYVYGAGELTSLNYYLDKLPEELDKDIGVGIFSLFYNYLDKLFKSVDFFRTPIKSIQEELKKNFKNIKDICIITGDGAKIPLIYYLMVSYRLDRVIKGKRNTIVFSKLTDYPDKVKTFRSCIANITQSLDAYYVRLIIKRYGPLITIHDCFGVDILNIDLLLEIANYSINGISYDLKEISIENDDTFKKYFLKGSPFILI